MTPQEANKIICDYMDITCRDNWNELYPHAKSLDALVPVWDKMPADMVTIITKTPLGSSVQMAGHKFYNGKTIKEAAAIATAKAIKELES